MKKILFLSSILVFLAFMSCDDDRFSPIYEVDIPPHTPRLVIRADWTAGSDSLAVFVSKSRSVLDKTKTNFRDTFKFGTEIYIQEYYDTVPNVKVELLREGQVLGTIPYAGKGYHVAKKLFKLDTVSGVTYTLRVSAPNFTTVEASQKTQKSFSILRGGHKADAAVSQDALDPFSSPERGDELTLELQDKAEDENYYTLEAFVGMNTFIGGGSSVGIHRDTLGRTYEAYGNIRNIDQNMDDFTLPDRTFNGKNYVWRFWLNPNLYFYNQASGIQFRGRPKSGDRITVQIRSLNKDYYLFAKTLKLANQAQDNPFFSEPVILHSNVKNGYGIFTIGSVQRVFFVIP
jgi:hypothetical protein